MAINDPIEKEYDSKDLKVMMSHLGFVTHEQLAAFTGWNRESITRMLNGKIAVPKRLSRILEYENELRNLRHRVNRLEMWRKQVIESVNKVV